MKKIIEISTCIQCKFSYYKYNEPNGTGIPYCSFNNRELVKETMQVLIPEFCKLPDSKSNLNYEDDPCNPL